MQISIHENSFKILQYFYTISHFFYQDDGYMSNEFQLKFDCFSDIHMKTEFVFEQNGEFFF